MTSDECMALLDYFRVRFQLAGMNPWHRWATAIPITWAKLQVWKERLENARHQDHNSC